MTAQHGGGHGLAEGKGPLRDRDAQALLQRGFTDEWAPCRLDLPGNWHRVLLPRRGERPPGSGRARRGKGGPAP